MTRMLLASLMCVSAASVPSHKFAIIDRGRFASLCQGWRQTATESAMTVQQLASLILSDDERAELTSLTMRRKTAQALALRARIVPVRRVVRIRKWRPSWGWTGRR